MLSTKVNNDQIMNSLVLIDNFKKKLDDMCIGTNNSLDKYQNYNIELSNSVNEKLKLLNSKVDIFKNEICKIWKFEENIFLELDKIKFDTNDKQNSMMKF